VDKPEKILDFNEKTILNTSLMHSAGEKPGFLAPLGSIFQVIDFKEK
jgi:hypothetical protein